MDLIEKVKRTLGYLQIFGVRDGITEIKHDRKLVDSEAGFQQVMGAVITLVMLGVILYVGMLILGKTAQVVVGNDSAGGNVSAQGLSFGWQSNITSINTGILSSLQLSPIIILVVIAGIIIAILVGTLGRQQ